MRKVVIKIYEFKELKEDIQERVINNYIDYLLNIIDFNALHKNSNMYKAIKKAQDMQTPWFTGQYVWEYCKKDILNDVSNNEYYENGEIYVKGE